MASGGSGSGCRGVSWADDLDLGLHNEAGFSGAGLEKRRMHEWEVHGCSRILPDAV